MKYIWLDLIDKSTIHFGIKYKDKFYIWFSVPHDGISEMFHQDVLDVVKELSPGIPKELDELIILWR